MLFLAFALLLFSSFVLSAPTATVREPSPAPRLPRYCSWLPLGRCSKWNPFQYRITEVLTHTVVEQVTSTVYVVVDHKPKTINPALTEVHTGMAEGGCSMAYSTTPGARRRTGKKGTPTLPTPFKYKQAISRTASPEMATQHPDCTYHMQGTHHPSSDEIVSVLMTNSHKRKELPTGVVSIWKGDGGVNIPSTVPEQPSQREIPSNEIVIKEGWSPQAKCLKRAHYTYVATFDDLHVPYISKPYNGLFFSEHFSVFEPSLVYSNYTAPSPPFAAITYPSSNARITSCSPFNLKSMYVGCEFAQSCLIRIRGWSPNLIHPTSELQVKVTHDTNNWTFVRFSNFGFNQVTLLEFDVLDLTTGTKNTLGMTLDQVTFDKEISEMHDCFD